MTSGKKKPSREDETDDLTKDMDDPTPEPNIQEVSISKQSELTLLRLFCLTLFVFMREKMKRKGERERD